MSEQKTAKIAEIVKTREWPNPKGGSVFYSTIKMDNGDVGEIGKKQANAVKVGDELTYNLEPNGEYIAKIKPVFQGNGFGGGGFAGRGKQGSTASFALSYAKDIAVANISKSDKPIEMDALAGKIIATADKFQNWLKANES